MTRSADLDSHAALDRPFARRHVLRRPPHRAARAPWGQLIYAASGVMRVTADDTFWIVPPARAVWAPAGVQHEIHAQGDFAMRTVYVATSLTERLPVKSRAIEVTPLLRELVLRIVGIGILDEATPLHRGLAEVLLDEIAAAPVLPVSVPLPRDRRALAVATRLQQDPADGTHLDALARDAGASARTIQRLFADETGLRFTEWRRRLRLLHALEALGRGTTVTAAAVAAGYESPSAFVAAFRRTLGFTPTQLDAVTRAR